MNTEENQRRARSEGSSDELKHSEAKLRRIIDTIPVIAWSGLPDGSAEFWNRRWRDYTGICLEDATGCGCRAAIHPEDLEHIAGENRFNPHNLTASAANASGLLQIAASTMLRTGTPALRQPLPAEHCRYGTRDLATTE